MKTYNNIQYFTTWMRGNWYLVLPDFQKSIQLQDPCSENDIERIIDNEVCQFI